MRRLTRLEPPIIVLRFENDRHAIVNRLDHVIGIGGDDRVGSSVCPVALSFHRSHRPANAKRLPCFMPIPNGCFFFSRSAATHRTSPQAQGNGAVSSHRGTQGW